MEIGVVFPQTEMETDAGAARAYIQAVEQLGYAHLLAYEHVVGADRRVHENFTGPYDLQTTFHEPFVLFGFAAALTTRLRFVTGIVILPQRQTVLVAKQAAELDVLSGGRLRLGVGLGWNKVEYDALGKDFSTRGRRLGEQVDLLRKLWTTESVTFDGTYEQVVGAGLAPLPVQRPIPVWFGATSAPALRRTGRLADGWFPMSQPGPKLDDALALVHQAAAEAGRDPATIGLEGRVTAGPGTLDDALSRVAAWKAVGASHLSINTMGVGLTSVDQHLAVLEKIAPLC